MAALAPLSPPIREGFLKEGADQIEGLPRGVRGRKDSTGRGRGLLFTPATPRSSSRVQILPPSHFPIPTA